MTNDYSTDPLPGWRATGEITEVSWDASTDLPARTDPGPADRGKNFFAGGPGGTLNTATQTDALPAGAAGMSYILSACLGGWADQGDNATVTAVFRDATGAAVGTASIGPVTAEDRDNTTALLARQTQGTVSPTAMSVQVTMTMNRIDGTYNDGYADNLSLALFR